MNRIFITAVVFLFTFSCFAGARIGGCTGETNGVKIEFKGRMSNNLDMSTLRGSLLVDGREVATWVGDDLDYSILKWSYQASNDRGDFVSGKVLNILKKTGRIKVIKIPAYGIELHDVFITCWKKSV